MAQHRFPRFTVWIECTCGHRVDQFGFVEFPKPAEILPRLKCTKCGRVGQARMTPEKDIFPNWQRAFRRDRPADD